MDNIFNIKRFWHYLLYDLRNARNRYWLSSLILGLIPVSMYVIYELMSVVIAGEWMPYNPVSQWAAFGISFVTVVLNFPVKVYGKLTEKKTGSDWLMIPASAFEKWLSMILIVCIVMPVCIGLMLFGSDAILSAAIPNYGKSLLTYFKDVNRMISDSSNGILSINLHPVLFLNWCENILIFTLGAIYFKRSKAAKTILAYFALSMILTPVMMMVVGSDHISSEDIEWMLNGNTLTVETFISKVNAAVSIIYILILGGLLGGIFARIKTLKH
ncbi:MAG: hypothetical protein MJY69_04980 [Bacteroidales bacterium]|nr:hypothetical protein [Bacteroidales bacterium]